MKRTRLTNEQKVKIINELKAGVINKEQVLQKYNIARKTLWEILKHEKIIRELASSFSMKSKKANKRPHDQMLEDALTKWLHRTKELGGLITGPIIQQKALNIYDQLEAEAQDREIILPKGKGRKFMASEGWLNGFKKRHGIRISAKEVILSSDTEGAALFQEESKESSASVDGADLFHDTKGEILFHDTKEDVLFHETKEDVLFHETKDDVLLKEREILSSDTEGTASFQEESKGSSSTENAAQCFNSLSWLQTQKEIEIPEEDMISIRRLRKLVLGHVALESSVGNIFNNL